MGCAAGRELREETVMYLRSESKETSVMAAMTSATLLKAGGLVLGILWDSERRESN